MTKYRHDVLDNEPQSYLWAFQKTAHPEMEEPTRKHSHCVLKIHSIIINGTEDGGASFCEPCNTRRSSRRMSHMAAFSSSSESPDECEPCPDGEFYTSYADRCLRCPTSKALFSNQQFRQLFHPKILNWSWIFGLLWICLSLC